VYAIFEDGSRQYWVQPGDVIDLDRRDLEEGQETIEFDRVLLVGRGEDLLVGRPVVEGAKVVAKVVGELKGPKIHIYKYKRRKGYRLKKGHRQRYLRVEIAEIVAP